jgi:hypothetical protein
VNRKNRPVSDFISIPEEVTEKITTEEKRQSIDLMEIELEAPNIIDQLNNDDALNE